MRVAYIGTFLHGFVFLIVLVNGAWGQKHFSKPLMVVLALLFARICVYAYAYTHATVSLTQPTETFNVCLLSFEIVASMWHVFVAARVARSKRFVMCTLAGVAALTDILIGSDDQDSCSFFAPVGFVLVFVGFILLARAIRGGSNPYSMHSKRVPLELVAFHLFAIVALLTSTVRSSACLNKASENATGAAIVLADALALAPILLTSWLKMDELSDVDEYDDGDSEEAL
jgi:hypothetical protein